MTKRYFKRNAQSELGIGEVWFEFDGELPARQVERYEDRWFSSRTEYHDEIGPGLVDQPLSTLELSTEHEIDAEEFEQAWRLARER
jgi:hypothetical protein